jgi:hypothetical protein
MNRQTNRFGFWIAAAAFISGAVPVLAQSVNPQFGMVGLASGETLRLNVVAYPPAWLRALRLCRLGLELKALRTPSTAGADLPGVSQGRCFPDCAISSPTS